MIGAVLLAVIVGVLTFAIWCIGQKRRYKCLDFIPGKKPLPIIGNAFDLGTDPVGQLKTLRQMRETYGPLYKLWLGPNNVMIFICDPEMTEFFLSSPKYINKSFGYDLLYSWLNQGLITANASSWHKKRKLLTSTFHFKILEQFVPIFHNAGKIFVKILSEKVGEDGINLHEYLKRCTLDITCETAMGTSVNAQENVNHKYVQAINKQCNTIVRRLFSFWMRQDFFFQFSPGAKDQKEALSIIQGFVKSVVENRRKALLHNKDAAVADMHDDIGVKKRIALLDSLLQCTIDGQPMTDKEICEEVDTFMFAGHDTTAAALVFAFYELARNPDFQEKMLEEIISVLGPNKDAVPTSEQLNAMKFTELVLKETLRLYPSVPYFVRTLDHDVVYNERKYPKGTNLFFLNFCMHRDPKYFENPLQFNPYRFLENMATKNCFKYIPFSAGPRNCIGQKFAMYAMKCVLVNVIRNFELVLTDPNQELDLSATLILEPAEHILFQVKKRQ